MHAALFLSSNPLLTINKLTPSLCIKTTDMDMDDAVSLLGNDNDNELDDGDNLLMGMSNALVGSYKAADMGERTSPSRSSTGSFASVDITGSSSAAKNTTPAVSRITASVLAPGLAHTSIAAAEEKVELHPRLISNKELGVLSVLRAEGSHFTAAGRAAMASRSLEAMEEGMEPEINEGDDDKKLGKNAAAGYAAAKKIGGGIAAALGFAQGMVEREEKAEKKEKRTAWQKFCLGMKIIFGWFLLAVTTVLSVLASAVKDNPLKTASLVIIWCTMLARGVSFWDIVTQSIDSYKAKKE
ncbi:hypothetical protein CALCODRAFT_504717 [Calocera cornea HHB12733]|uniref:Uncharacterized protein n=1 Tax=Calocera cornea HHB12733 TaxID=1353952 RepID=A0A165C9W7_9BASI|nr:hypothetical protein CALCODRAFT_504717 [Calocera cornea HHB12733]